MALSPTIITVGKPLRFSLASKHKNGKPSRANPLFKRADTFKRWPVTSGGYWRTEKNQHRFDFTQHSHVMLPAHDACRSLGGLPMRTSFSTINNTTTQNGKRAPAPGGVRHPSHTSPHLSCSLRHTTSSNRPRDLLPAPGALVSTFLATSIALSQCFRGKSVSRTCKRSSDVQSLEDANVGPEGADVPGMAPSAASPKNQGPTE